MLDYTAQQSSGLASWFRDTDHIEKGFVFGGMPARNGVTSALLVQAGWNGVDDVLSGRDNFLLANAPQANAELLVEKLGERYEIVGTTIKRWTVGTPIQAPLDAMEALLKRQPIDPGQVRHILVRSAPESVVDNSDPPDINIQYAMALMLIDKTATFRSIHDKPRMQDPAILRLRAMVRLEAPAGRGGGPRLPLLEIALADGARLVQDAGPVLGTAENPMTRDQFVAKCRDLMAPVLGAAPSMRLIDRVLELERAKDIRELRPLLQRTYRAGPPRLSEYPATNDGARPRRCALADPAHLRPAQYSFANNGCVRQNSSVIGVGSLWRTRMHRGRHIVAALAVGGCISATVGAGSSNTPRVSQSGASRREDSQLAEERKCASAWPGRPGWPRLPRRPLPPGGLRQVLHHLP